MSDAADELAVRFTHHPPGDSAQRDSYERIRGGARELAQLASSRIEASRELSLALTKLEEFVFWANAAIARAPARAKLEGGS